MLCGRWKMASKKATISARISPYTFQRLAREMDAEIQRVNKFSRSLGKALAKHVAELAQDEFDNAEYDGVNDVVVSVRQTKKGNYSVAATGEAVTFIEYGAGVYFADQAYPGDIPSRYGGIGDYGNGHGNEEAWWFEYRSGVETTAGGTVFEGKKRVKETFKQLIPYGRKNAMKEVSVTDYAYDEEGNYIYEPSGHTWVYTHGNPANACMYTAYEYTLDDFDEIVEEVEGD